MSRVAIFVSVTMLIIMFQTDGMAEAKNTADNQRTVQGNAQVRCGNSSSGNTSGTSGRVPCGSPGCARRNDMPRPYPIPDKKRTKVRTVRKRGRRGRKSVGGCAEKCRQDEKSPAQESETEILTRKIGSGPILEHYIKRMGVVPIIDRMVPAHPGRKISHGEMVAGLMVYLLNGGRALYRMEKWAGETAIPGHVFPQYEPGDWTDDRIDDTLDEIFRSGPEHVQGAVSANMVREFDLRLDQIHYDTTSVSMWGTYDPAAGQPAVVITFGYSKDHRPDLRQIVVGTAVTGDGGVPLISGTHDGNTSDSVLPVSYWERLRQTAGTSSFCFIGDSKIASEETLAEICGQDGQFLAPLPMTEPEQKRLIAKLGENELKFVPADPKNAEKPKPVYEKRTDRPGNRRRKEGKPEKPDRYEVCEETRLITDTRGREHTLRKLVIRSGRLARLHAGTRERRLRKAEAEFRRLRGKLNKRKLTTREAVESAVSGILSGCRVRGLIKADITEHTEILRKQTGRGRPGPNTRYTEERKVIFDISVRRQQPKIEEKALLDGIFLMVANHDSGQWSSSDLLALYKRQYKVERAFRTLKSPLAVSPVLLEKPDRICAMMFVMTLALQLYTLIQREAARELLRRNSPLEGLMPNRIRTWRPQTDELLAAFDNINLVEIVHNGISSSHITDLNPVQTEILLLLGVPVAKYSPGAYTHKSGET